MGPGGASSSLRPWGVPAADGGAAPWLGGAPVGVPGDGSHRAGDSLFAVPDFAGFSRGEGPGLGGPT